MNGKQEYGHIYLTAVKLCLAVIVRGGGGGGGVASMKEGPPKTFHRWMPFPEFQYLWSVRNQDDRVFDNSVS